MVDKKEVEYLQICFLLYISVKEDIKYGNVLFWSWKTEKIKYMNFVKKNLFYFF
jgi:hypothetical protein